MSALPPRGVDSVIPNPKLSIMPALYYTNLYIVIGARSPYFHVKWRIKAEMYMVTIMDIDLPDTLNVSRVVARVIGAHNSARL